MKRKITICLMVALVVIMMALPAFADSTYTAYLEHGILVLPEEPSPGTYRLSFALASDDGVTDTVVIENVKLMQHQSDFDCFMVAEFILSEPGEGDIPLYLVILHDSADYDSQFPNWHPVAVTIQDDGGNMLPLASLSLERVTEPVTTENVMDSLGSFVSSSLSMLGGVLSAIANSPALLVTVVALPLGGIAVAVVSKLKNA